MEIKTNDIDLKNSQRFGVFSNVTFNCKSKYCCFNKKLNNIQTVLTGRKLCLNSI